MSTKNNVTLFSTKGQKTTVNGEFQITPYFKAKELCCPTGKVIKCADGFLIHLTYLRHMIGLPFTLNSCCRTPEHNVSVGGNKNSMHLTEGSKHNTGGACAVDISVERWTLPQLTLLLTWGRTLGWSIGHGYIINENGIISGFVHIDCRSFFTKLPQNEFY